MMLLENNGPVFFAISDTDNSSRWNISNNNAGGDFLMTKEGSGITAFALEGNGDLTIDGTLTTGGPTCGMGCDRVFSEDYALPSIEEHAAEMWSSSHLPASRPDPGGRQPLQRDGGRWRAS